MMSMTTLKSSSQASTYYSKDNYYTKEPTAESLEKAEWYGKGAEVLGLVDQDFDPDKFKEILEGTIDEDNKIGRVTYEDGVAVTQHRPGVDLTFSAPKSVSIISEVFKDDDVRNAHEDAVKATLDFVEKKYAQTRISVDGSMQKVDTENLYKEISTFIILSTFSSVPFSDNKNIFTILKIRGKNEVWLTSQGEDFIRVFTFDTKYNLNYSFKIPLSTISNAFSMFSPLRTI